MSTEGQIVTTVVSDATLAALIDTRIYPVKLPATPTLPAMTYQLVSDDPEPIQDGPGMTTTRWRFRIWTKRYGELRPISDALHALFDARHVSPFRSSFADGMFEDYDTKSDRYWRIVDVLGWQPAGVDQAS